MKYSLSSQPGASEKVPRRHRISREACSPLEAKAMWADQPDDHERNGAGLFACRSIC
jgi:hypothetical protein